MKAQSYFIFFVAAMFCFSCMDTSAYQLQIFKSNKYDHHGKRHGKWKFYSDNEEKLVFSKGRFKHGSSAGVWKYYDSNGKLRKKEKYNKTRTVIKTTFYYSNGKVECTGLAKLDSEGELLHYYWDGPWQYFDDTGNFIKIIIYKMGNEVVTEKFY